MTETVFQNKRIILGIVCAGILEFIYAVFFGWFYEPPWPIALGGVLSFITAILSGMFLKKKSIIILVVILSWGAGIIIGMKMNECCPVDEYG